MGREEEPELVTDDRLPRKAPMRGMPDAFGMCSQLVGAGACDSVLVGEGPRIGEPSVTESSGRVSIGARAMRVRACRRGGCDGGRWDRDGPGSKSGELGRAENELNEGAKRRGKRRASVLGPGSAVSGVVTSDCAVKDLKGEYSVLLAFGSGSRSGADASAEMVRLWTSPRRLWAVDEVSPLDVELLLCLGWRLEARRRANGTRTRMAVTTKRIPPRQPTTMYARLFLLDEGEVDVLVLGWQERGKVN